jgi:heat shock protein HtpX
MVRDTALRRRVRRTLLAVLAIDLAFVLVLAFLLDPWLVGVSEAVVAAAGLDGSVARLRWVVVLVVATAAFLALQLLYTCRQTLAEADATVTDASRHPDLLARVNRLSQQADVTTPTVAVTDADVPNSFTVGGVRNATLVVSEGLLETLPEDELDAVLAHELAHVKNRDARVMTLASFLPGLVNGDLAPRNGTLTGLLGIVVAFALYALSAPRLPGSPTGAETVVTFAVALVLSAVVAGIALGVLATPVLFLARRLSQDREFAADRAGAIVSGDPAALANALRRLDADADRAPDADARTAYDGVSRLCLLPHGFDDPTAERDAGDDFHVEVQSHPPTSDRIDRLGELARELET